MLCPVNVIIYQMHFFLMNGKSTREKEHKNIFDICVAKTINNVDKAKVTQYSG